ncbi:MAG: hypothetical protein AAB441_02930 [Patescibacteria group bacterium]
MKSLFIIQYIFLGILLGSMLKSYPSFPKEFVNDRNNFEKINQLSDEIANLQSPAFKKIANDDQEKIYSKINEMISLNDKIDPRYFDYFNSEFRYYFAGKNIEGTKIYYEGLKEKDSRKKVELQFRGNSLREEWFKWWKKNSNEVYYQAYPPERRSPIITIIIFLALWTISMFISPFTILSVLIILRFGIPVTKKLNKLNLLKKNNAIIRNYWLFLFFLSLVFFGIHYLLSKIFGLTYSFCILVGLTMILPGIGKIGVNNENVDDYIRVNKEDFVKPESEIISAIFSI